MGSNVKFLPVGKMGKILCFNIILFFIGVHSGILVDDDVKMFQICYKCLVSENCFSDNSNDGIVGNCEVPPNNVCYKAIFEYNGTIGIQRGCAQIPEDSIEGECNFEDILNGTTKAEVCYCRGNSCNYGDIFTTTKIPTKDPSTFPPFL